MAEVRRALEMDRSFGNGYLILSLAYGEMGNHDRAIEMAKKGQELMEGSALPLWTFGHALGRAGKRAEAQAVADKLKKLSTQVYISPYYQALVYTGLSDRESAFAYLEKAVETRDEWLLWLGTEPKLDDLRSDPRFAGLLQRVGLKGDETEKAHAFASERASSLPPSQSAAEKKPSNTGEISPAMPTLPEAVYPGFRDYRKAGRWILGVVLVALMLGTAFVVYRFTRTSVMHFSTPTLSKLTATGISLMSQFRRMESTPLI